MRERKHRPSLMILSDRDALILKLLSEFQRHDVSKVRVLQFLTFIFTRYRHRQDSLIQTGATESLKDVVRLNKDLQKVVEKLEVITVTEEGIVRMITENNPTWELFSKAIETMADNAT